MPCFAGFFSSETLIFLIPQLLQAGVAYSETDLQLNADSMLTCSYDPHCSVAVSFGGLEMA